ncbi:MAG: EamA family transporter [Alphaproteobacteria bacterium]|nr:EamA family transporter [Alphaproteobacteria bacterium]
MTLSPIALAAVLGSAVLHAGWNVAIRAQRDRRREMALVVVGAAVICALVLPFLTPPARESWPYLGASGVLHVLYFILIGEAYSRGGVSLAYPLMRGTAPVLTACFTVTLLGETLSPWGWAGIFGISTGVVLMARRSGEPGETAAIPFALANSLVIAAYTLNDALGARASGSPVAYTLWVEPLSLVPSLLWLLRGRRIVLPSGREVLRGLGGGGCSMAAYAIALWAMTIAPIAPVAAVRETAMLFGVAFAWLFLGERPGRRGWAAVAVIALGAAALRFG